MPKEKWTPEEDGFLRCPIPAYYLAAGALRHRTEDGIRSRRYSLGIHYTKALHSLFTSLGCRNQARLRYSDYPRVDWAATVEQLSEALAVGWNTAWRLKKEAGEAGAAGVKPYRKNRRKLSYQDYPGIDWSLPTPALVKQTGLSRQVVYRLVREAGYAPKKPGSSGCDKRQG